MVRNVLKTVFYAFNILQSFELIGYQFRIKFRIKFRIFLQIFVILDFPRILIIWDEFPFSQLDGRIQSRTESPSVRNVPKTVIITIAFSE